MVDMRRVSGVFILLAVPGVALMLGVFIMPGGRVMDMHLRPGFIHRHRRFSAMTGLVGMFGVRMHGMPGVFFRRSMRTVLGSRLSIRGLGMAAILGRTALPRLFLLLFWKIVFSRPFMGSVLVIHRMMVVLIGFFHHLPILVYHLAYLPEGEIPLSLSMRYPSCAPIPRLSPPVFRIIPGRYRAGVRQYPIKAVKVIKKWSKPSQREGSDG
jgi:hypothetical protein